MSFVKFLQGVGDRLGILEAVSNPGDAAPVRIQTRIVTLRELTSEIDPGQVRALADSPAELAIPFDKIFETAGISSNPKDWTIERLRQVVASESLKNKPREEVQKSILNLLKAEGVPAESIVKDAMARDQALDSFEDFAREKVRERTDTCKRRLLEIETRIGDLQEERASLEARLKTDEEKWREWKKRKRAIEHDLASAASYIVDHPVITEGDDAS